MHNPQLFRIVRMSLLALLYSLATAGAAQNPSLKVFEDWRTETGTQNMFFKAGAVAIPGSLNSIVFGATLNANGDYDLLVQKLDNSGSAVWTYQYNGAGNGDDIAADVFYDPASGYTYVAGSYFASSADSFNAIVIALDASGNLDWSATYNGTGSGADGFLDVEVDPASGDIFCTGSEWGGPGTLYDVLLVRYDATGSLLWSTTYEHSWMIDGGYKIVLGSKPKLMAVVQDGLTSFQYGLVGIDLATGNVQGALFSGGTAMGYDRAAAVVRDDTGNVYLVGSVYNLSTLSDIRVTKYDTLLNVVWEHDIDASYNLNDYGSGIALDADNNVLVLGSSETYFNGMNYTVLKFDNAGGLRFFRTYNGSANVNDSATAIVASPNDTNGIYITGYSFNGATNDYWTLRLDAAGNLMWDIGMNSLLNGDDRATAIALDTLGDVIVTGQTRLRDTVYGYTTVRYVQKEVMLPGDTTIGASSSFIFIENRGQIMGSDSAMHPEIKFYVDRGLPKLYFMDTAVAYVFAKIATVNQNDSLTRVDMKFVNANNGLSVYPMDVKDEYSNYFLDHIPEGRSRVQHYGQLVSLNVWHNVDIVYGSNSRGLKYYFIGKPGGGGNPMTQIDLEYLGADSVEISAGGELVIYTKLGSIVQPQAAAWQLDANGNYQPLGWQPSYVKLGAYEVGFTAFGAFNVLLPLVFAIDWGNSQPQNTANISWSTFYGGGLLDQFNDVRTSNSGKIATCGTTTSSNFPTSSNIYNSPQGQHDATVVVFNSDGSRDWATYYGGTSQDYANGIDINPLNGNIFFVGETSSYGFPIQAWGNAELNPPPVNALNPEQYIVQLSHDGQAKIWSTCYGGSSRDVAHDIRISHAAATAGDIYVVGYTQGAIPLYAAPSWAAGHGTILKFNPQGVLQMATNFGSSGGGSLEDVAIDKNGDVVVVGWVDNSSGVPIQNAGGNPVYGGGSADGVICKFSGVNSNIYWCTYYGGDGHDAARSIEVSPSGGQYVFYYVAGETTSDNGLPVVNPGWGYNQSSLGASGYSDAFVVQINEWGGFMWSTYFGGTDNDKAWSVTIDASQNVYVLGETESSDIPFPAFNLLNGYSAPVLNGPSDGFLACFQSFVYNHVWTTYFGGYMEDYIYSATCSSNTDLYLVGITNCRPDFPLDDGGGIPYYDGNVFGVKGFVTRLNLAPVIVAGANQQIMNTSNIILFPNPADQTVRIFTSAAPGSNMIVTIRDISGQDILVQNYTGGSAVIDIGNFASGSYIVSVCYDGLVTNGKLIIQH